MKRGVGAGVNGRGRGPHPERPAAAARRRPTLRALVWLALLLMAAIAAGTGFAWMLAQRADDALEASHRRALRGAIEALQGVSPSQPGVEPSHIPVLQRASGLRDLQFESDPPGAGRSVQSLIDHNGRIVGWLSWEAEQPAAAMMRQLLPLAALIATGLLGFAVLAMWQLSRLGRMLVESEQTVHRLAHADPITGLPNQHHLFEVIDGALAARKGGEVVAFVLLDFGDFDGIKDMLDSGEDGLLEEVAARLRGSVPRNTTVGRLHGDTFGLVIPARTAEEALVIAGRAREEASRAIWLERVVQISANAGLAIAPRDGTTRHELKHRADLALRSAFRRGRGLLVVFENEMEAEFEERAFIKQELARALPMRAFDLHYQPIVRADNAAIVGVEALLRWEHPIRGFIPPALFVRVAEDAGLMEELGAFVLRRALADAVRWPNLYLSVNLSPVQVRDSRFVELVSAVLAETGIAPSRLVLEMTEGVLIDNPATAKGRLEDLRRLGVRLALDDFGAGYSSLGYLQRLPFDKLKVDGQFVSALNVSANAGVVIQAIVALGRALGMSVLIEGVETEEQRVLVRLAGCDEMQGFLFAKPMPREEIDRLVAGKASLGPKPDRRSMT